jgi:uncharacterized protein with von Willebrand factor type A (vWA) domain
MTPPEPLAPALARLYVRFCRRLRDAGLPVPATAAADLLRVALQLDVEDRRRFHACARALLTTDRRDWPLFDAVFFDFWRLSAGDDAGAQFQARGSRGLDPVPASFPSTAAPPGAAGEDSSRAPRGGFGAGCGPGAARPDAGVAVTAGASWADVVGGRELHALTADSVIAARRLLPLARTAVPPRLVRRPAPGPRAIRTDLRATLRQAARCGGVVADPVVLDLRRRTRRVVVIGDASRSMRLYTSAVLGVPRLLAEALDDVEVFFFASRLSRVTHLMRRPPSAMLRGLADEVPDWGGGTRIGAALGAFNRRWGDRTLDAVVVLITDGLDAGDPDALTREAAHLRRRCWRLVWLNPLAAGAGFEPRATGIRALLGAVDLMLPIRDLATVETFLTTMRRFRGNRGTDPLLRPAVVLPAFGSGA